MVATQNWVVPRIHIRPCHVYDRDFFIAFKEPRPKVAGEFKDIGADGAKARSTLLSKEGVMKQSFETSNCIMVFLFLSWVIRIRPMVIM